MPKFNFNLGSLIVNLTIGWFLMSFIQAAVRALRSGARGDLIPRFKTIAFFHDKPAALLNIAIMAGIWIVTTSLYFTLKRR
ncbi:MAG: hypothetical protein AAGU26_04505 [bacterium]|jgi:hypothetical protein|uniref:Uncharacterized protein n=1 Tax=uncultured Spirochaetota bacterium TaxID=460511 RepID=A0A652ZWB9_9SPIR|nr:hypothetical protein TRIP_E280061 [uncultured Spirochaetota bacterium]